MDLLNSFLPCQIEYILDESKILGVEKSRQVGITWASGYKVCRRIFKSGIPQDHFWISKDEFTAKLFLSSILKWIQIFNEVSNHKKEFKRSVVDFKGVQAMRVKFPCGSNIYVLSSSIDAVVGKVGNFYVDEAAVHKDFQQLFDIALPCTTWGYTFTFFSTHRSKQNYFYKLIEKIRKGELIGGNVLRITLQDVLDQGYVKRINAKSLLLGGETYDDTFDESGKLITTAEEQFYNEKKTNTSSEEIFMQEYMCIPADADATQAVKEDDLDRIMFPQADLFTRPQPGKKYYAGIDIGRNRDLTVIWICEDISDSSQPMLVTRYIETMSMVEFSTQERKLAELLNKWKPRHCMIDGTTIGKHVAENLSKRFHFCESAVFTAVTRPQWIGDLIGFIRRDTGSKEDKGVCLKVPNSNEVWADFLSVERYVNKYGKEDFFIPAHRGTDSHGDRFMSMVLCLQAFMSKRSMARYTLQTEKKIGPRKPKIQKKSAFKQKFRY